ncbi:MAG: hypothetical protein J6C33_07525 [Lachnospiraceae bacterium]|nr:hypothetical protein [Lachnospiraceae bacterium]
MAGYEEGVKAGKMAGKKAGERIGTLCGKRESILLILSDMGSVPEEVHTRIEEETDSDQLGLWLKEAVKASCIDEFVRALF